MSEVSCNYVMTMINEEETLEKDLLVGKSLDILLRLLSTNMTPRQLSIEMDCSVVTIQVYLNRLLKGNLVKVVETRIIDGKIEKVYGLVSTNINIFNNLCRESEMKKDQSIRLSAEHFASLTKKAIINVNGHKDKPHKIKAYYIKANDEKMNEFKLELDKLFEKYQSLEDLDANDTYSFISVLSAMD